MAQNVEQTLIRGLKMLKVKYMPRVTSYYLKHSFHSPNYVLNGNKAINFLKRDDFSLWLHQSKVFYSTNEDTASKTKEKVDQQIIYYGSLTSKIKGLKVVSYSTSLISIFLQPVIYDQIVAMAAPAVAVFYTIVGFFTFVTPILIHSITKKYIVEIRYDASQDSYMLKTMTFFLRDKIVNFRLDDIEIIETPSLFNSFLIKGKPMIIFQEGFFDKVHYVKMMGYDKPLDLSLGEDTNTSDSTGKSQPQK